MPLTDFGRLNKFNVQKILHGGMTVKDCDELEADARWWLIHNEHCESFLCEYTGEKRWRIKQ